MSIATRCVFFDLITEIINAKYDKKTEGKKYLALVGLNSFIKIMGNSVLRISSQT